MWTLNTYKEHVYIKIKDQWEEFVSDELDFRW